MFFSRLSPTDKIIIFVNLKKQGDTVGKYCETSGFQCGVLHGGRSQDQREETLDMFRNNEIQVISLDLIRSSFQILTLTHSFTHFFLFKLIDFNCN